MDYVDKFFKDTDASVSPEHTELYSQVKEVARPFIDRWMADPLADHHDLHTEMTAAIVAFLKKHSPDMQGDDSSHSK